MFVRRLIIGSSIVGFFSVWSILAFARDDQDALKSRVLNEFPGALKALEEHFSEAVGTVDFSFKDGMATRRPQGMAGKFTFATRRPYLARVEARRIRPAKSSGNGAQHELPVSTASSVEHIVYCYNKNYSFNLVKRDDQPYIIKAFDKNVGGEPQEHLKVQVDGWLYEYLNAPFSFSAVNQPLSRIISSNRFSIQHISHVRQDGGNCLKLDVRLREGIWKIAQGRPSQEYVGWILVAPEKKWVLKEYEFDHGTTRIRGRVEYGDMEGDFPVPKRVVVDALDRSSNKPYFIHEFKFEELQFVGLSDGEFTLTAFGLPELSEPGRSRWRYANRTVFVLLGAAVVSLLVSVALKYFAGLARRTPPESFPDTAEDGPPGSPAN